MTAKTDPAAPVDVDNDSRLGEFVDRETLRFVRDFDHRPRIVWRTLIDRRQFAVWLWPCRRFEARAGGRFEFDVSGQAWSGRITRFEPPLSLSLDGRIAFDLAAHGEGCRLVVTLKRPPLGWSVMAIAGFHGWLGRLTRLVAGTPQAATEAWAAEIWKSVFPACEFLVRRQVAGGARPIYRLHFAEGDARLDTEAQSLLAQLAALLKARPDLNVVVDGFGDDPCAPGDDIALCQARIEAAKSHLAAAGLAGDRIEVGYVLGNYHYLVERDSAAGRAFNRRIELRPTY